MATFTVTTLGDEPFDGAEAEQSPDGEGISLREAIGLAAAADGPDEIIFDASLAGGTIRLANGTLVLTSDVAVDGDTDDDGAPDITVSGDVDGNDLTTTDPLGNAITDAINNGDEKWDNVGVFEVAGGYSRINGLVITGGSVTSNTGSGGGVRVAEGAVLALSNSSVSGNFVDGFAYGGGIENRGTVTLTDTTVSANRSNYWGGGILNAGTATVIGSTVSGNRSNYGGGGIYNDGSLTMLNTTVSDNASGWYVGARDRGGGGIFNSGTATLTNTTVSGNRSNDDGGGILNRSDANLTAINSTVSGNSAGYAAFDPPQANGQGGGISSVQSGTVTLSNTIVLGNAAPDGAEIHGQYLARGPNIIGAEPADVFAALDPDTGGGLLADNGGAVRTIALRNDAANPAVDAGVDRWLDESVVGINLNGNGALDDVIDTDARGSGFPRRVDLPAALGDGENAVDMGAFEVQAVEPAGIPVKVTFTGGSPEYANAFGIYDKSTLDAELLSADLDAVADGDVLYEAELTPELMEDLGFFLLPDGADANPDLESLVGAELTVIDTEDGYAVSVDGTPLSGVGAPALFSDAALNPLGFDNFAEDGTPSAYDLSVEEIAGGGDLDFDDASFRVEAGVPEAPVEVKVTFEGESASFRNTFGYFVDGTEKAGLVFADVDKTTLALGTMESFSLTADEYGNLSFFLIADGATRNADLFADLDAIDLIVEEVDGVLRARDEITDAVLEGSLYVPQAARNPDAVPHALKTGSVDAFTLNWEDLPNGGDADYNDAVFGVQITAADDPLV